jgi:hypothetical protein
LEETHFADLHTIVRALAEAAVRTETRLQTLAAAQEHAETRVETLAAHLDALTGRVDTLALRMEDLAQAQLRTEDEVARLRRTIETQIGGLGARWGMQAEEVFRQAMKTILEEVGFVISRMTRPARCLGTPTR